MMDRQHVEEQVLTVLNAVLKCEVTAQSSRNDLPQWDSLKHIEVIFAIEDALGIQFPEEELADLDSVPKIVDRAVTQNAA